MAAFHECKESVTSLEDICVRWICKNLSLVTYVNYKGKRRWRFHDKKSRLVARPAQKILLQMCKRGYLDDEYMTLFSHKYVDLTSPVLKDSLVTPKALKVLREFRLCNLSAINLHNVTLNSLIGCLGEWTVKHLLSLNISNTSIVCESKVPIVVALSRFKNLKVLNVSKTEFTNQCLQIVVKDLPELRHLNISRTRVTDISPLSALQDRLEALVMHRLDVMAWDAVDTLLNTIISLRKLQYLDVSSRPSHTMPPRCTAVTMLSCGVALPNLAYLDVSGNLFGMRLQDLRNLIVHCPGLIYLGCAAWLWSSETELEGIFQLAQQNPHILMSGDRGESLLLNTLTKNKDRATFLQHALHFIFDATSSTSAVETIKPDLLSAVIRVMRLHMRREMLVLAGTAVVYNLTRGDQGTLLPLDLLIKAVRVILVAMEQYPRTRQLQKNCFLTLCSDNVLQRTSFNTKRCCELVFDGLIRFDEIHMKRMGVAIISILAAEITTADLEDLARDRRRIQRLLGYTTEKCLLRDDVTDQDVSPYLSVLRHNLRDHGAPVFDTTLRFTLSALWNLTDECPEACLAFVEESGLFVYHKVLQRFMDQADEMKNHVYTKCLGLLNNVAEVEETRKYLLFEDLMKFLLDMLQHSSIQISYFAAGIIAHLSCEPDLVWLKTLGYTKDRHVQVLGAAVAEWTAPECDMVAYRSFRPFQSLVLHCESRSEVHLWAVWAIHHVLSRKEVRYIPLLRQCEPMVRFLRGAVNAGSCVSAAPPVAPLLTRLAGEILAFIDLPQNPALSQAQQAGLSSSSLPPTV